MHERRKELIRFALLSALFVWASLSYIELGKYMYRGILFARVIDGRPYVSDFVNPYNAGLLAARCLQERDLNIWDIDVQNESLKKLIAPIKPEQPFYLQYPPYFWCLMMLESFMPMNIAWIMWNLLGVSLAVFALFKLSKMPGSMLILPQTDEGLMQSTLNCRAALLIAIVFSSYPAWLTVELGQPTLYVIPAAAGMLFLLGKQRYFLAGICSGLLIIKLQYAPFFLLIGLLFGRLKFLFGNITITLSMLLLSFFILGPHNVLNYPHALLSGETGRAVSGVSAFMMQNLRGELSILVPENFSSAANKAVIAFYAVGILSSAFILWKAMKKNSYAAFAMSTALSMMIGLLSSPHTHTQDYLLLGVCAVLLFNTSNISRENDRIATWIRWLLTSLAPLSWLFFFLQPIFLLLRIQPFFFYLCIIAVLLFIELQKELQAADTAVNLQNTEQ